MKTFEQFMRQIRDLQEGASIVHDEKSTNELQGTFRSRSSTLQEDRTIATGLLLRYRNQIIAERDINKKFALLIDAIALSSIETVDEIKKILKKGKQ